MALSIDINVGADLLLAFPEANTSESMYRYATQLDSMLSAEYPEADVSWTTHTRSGHTVRIQVEDEINDLDWQERDQIEQNCREISNRLWESQTWLVLADA
jgi:hypothetical protein